MRYERLVNLVGANDAREVAKILAVLPERERSARQAALVVNGRYARGDKIPASLCQNKITYWTPGGRGSRARGMRCRPAERRSASRRSQRRQRGGDAGYESSWP